MFEIAFLKAASELDNAISLGKSLGVDSIL